MITLDSDLTDLNETHNSFPFQELWNKLETWNMITLDSDLTDLNETYNSFPFQELWNKL